MKNLLTQLRCMTLFYHDCHNNAFGSSFISDHNLFRDFYEGIESDYDSIAERILGLGESEKISSYEILEPVKKLLAKLSEVSGDNIFKASLTLEENLRTLLQDVDKKATIGTSNMLQNIADKSEVRTYKIKQRIKGA